MQISTYLPVISGVIPFVVEYIKLSPLFQSITPETKGKLMTLAAALSAVAGLLTGLSDGTIDGPVLQMTIESVWQVAVTFGLVQGVYNFLKFLGVLGK